MQTVIRCNEGDAPAPAPDACAEDFYAGLVRTLQQTHSESSVVYNLLSGLGQHNRAMEAVTGRPFVYESNCHFEQISNLVRQILANHQLIQAQ